jgi:predicted HTH transcriptional regulator
MAFEFPAERNRIEYKSQLTDDFEESIVAFLNYEEGGEVYIGIDDKKKCVVETEDIDLVQRQITDRIKNNIQPQTLGLFDIIIEKIKDVEVVKIVVSSGIEKPYYLRRKGMSPQGCFIRVGSSNQPIIKELIEDIYSKRIPIRLSNMRSPRQKLTFQQLEIYYAEQKLRLNKEFLTSLDLIDEEGRYNYAAYLLADENGVSIKVAKYSGTTKVDLIENEEYGYRCLITATHRILDKLRAENKTFTKITAQKRINKQMIDEIALKEALINAIVHNDYSREVPPVVEIFSDRLTITSYGGLPMGLSKENFFRCRSLPRNRELMRVFRDIDLVEQLGSGMSRILEVYNSSIFTFEDDFLIVTFPFADKMTDKVTDKIVNGEKEFYESLLLHFSNGEWFSNSQARDVSGISESSVKRYLRNLTERSLLVAQGERKSRQYKLVY